MAVVLDSDAIIGFLDRGDALHGAATAAVSACVREQPLFASVVTYAEVLTGARLGHQEEARVKGFFSHLITELLPVDSAVADRAAALRAATKGLRMPDALIVAGADLAPQAGLLLSGDAVAAKVAGLSCDVQLLR